MFVRYVLPMVAMLGLGFSVSMVILGRQQPAIAEPYQQPPIRPTVAFQHEIAGAGLIEARDENIPIAANLPGVVTEVLVKVGQKVRKGDPLFVIDDRPFRADLKVRKAALTAAEAELHRLEKAPRAEDLPIAEAALEEAQANLSSAEVTLNRATQLIQRNAGTQSELDSARFAYQAAKAAVARTGADLIRLRRGTWEEDLQVSRAKVEQARAQVESVEIDLDRLTTRALADGKVLQVNVRPGQFAAVLWKEPLIVIGNDDRLHVRIDIDEHDLPYFKKDARAIGYLRGHTSPEDRFDLTFVRIEPYVIPKRSLTGDNSERVDTRVLQVIYALPDARPIDVFVGQQMDAYLDARAPDEQPDWPSPGLAPAGEIQ